MKGEERHLQDTKNDWTRNEMRSLEKETNDHLFSCTTFLRSIAISLLCLCFFFLPEAEAWWDKNWKYRKVIPFNTSANGADIKGDLTEFTILLRLHTGNFNFANAKPDGSDLRFVDQDDKQPLKFHIEKFNADEEIALVWVKVPRLAGGSSQGFIWMYYGNPSASNGQDRVGTFDSSYVMVYHLSETEGPPQDATSHGHHATSISGKSALPSVIGHGVRFQGGKDQVVIPKIEAIPLAKEFTFASWFRLNKPVQELRLLSWEGEKQGMVIGIEKTKPYVSFGSRDEKGRLHPQTANVALNTWNHLVVTVNEQQQVTLYLNGKELASAQSKEPLWRVAGNMVIGSAPQEGKTLALDMDEIQLSNVARSAEWVKASFQSQGPDGLLTAIPMEEETAKGGEESVTVQLLKIIFHNITADGWIIIGLLAIIGSASMVIFVDKTYTLYKARVENEQFLKAFKTQHHLEGLSNPAPIFKFSTLYQIYQSGYEELKNFLARRGPSFREERRFHPRAHENVRVALERANIMTSRKLSSGLFIINLAIAAGPFLGLLGTVWGVMNTFAGLAGATEANLLAIAPGVASALACTLSGLLVAIPALFIHIYITGHLKNLSADAIVFMDEFLLRLGMHEEEENEKKSL